MKPNNKKISYSHSRSLSLGTSIRLKSKTSGKDYENFDEKESSNNFSKSLNNQEESKLIENYENTAMNEQKEKIKSNVENIIKNLNEVICNIKDFKKLKKTN